MFCFSNHTKKSNHTWATTNDNTPFRRRAGSAGRTHSRAQRGAPRRHLSHSHQPSSSSPPSLSSSSTSSSSSTTPRSNLSNATTFCRGNTPRTNATCKGPVATTAAATAAAPRSTSKGGRPKLAGRSKATSEATTQSIRAERRNFGVVMGTFASQKRTKKKEREKKQKVSSLSLNNQTNTPFFTSLNVAMLK